MTGTKGTVKLEIFSVVENCLSNGIYNVLQGKLHCMKCLTEIRISSRLELPLVLMKFESKKDNRIFHRTTIVTTGGPMKFKG